MKFVEAITSRKKEKLYTFSRDLETAVTKRTEFSERKEFEIRRGAYYCALEYKFCFRLQGLERKEL